MNSVHLNEHDANQGAQSSGEFLGMTGNCGWYLLGSAGATILMVIILWGIFGVSLLLCLLVGIVLCLFSVLYVFTLKNNRPEHFDTDFFESALVEAGVVQFCFGPNDRRPANPFALGDAGLSTELQANGSRTLRTSPSSGRSRSQSCEMRQPVGEAGEQRAGGVERKRNEKPAEPMVSRVAYERVQADLTAAEEMLEETLATGEENE